MFKVLRGRIDQPGDPLRLSLAGEIIEGVTSLVERARTTGGQCYAALYELNDTELVQRLLVSPFVHTILSNTGQTDGTNRPARQGLEEAKVDLTSRMLPNGHIGHNKFVVYLDSTGTAKAVLSGSTNWTDTGLCGQANNAIVIENDELAAVYLDYWKRIKADTDAAGDDSRQLQAADYRTTNQTPHDVALADGSPVRVYFSPNIRQKTKSSGAATPVDLQEVFDHIAAAKHAVLFLAFEPGSPSIIDAIAKAQAANPELFVRGAVTDPKASGDYTTQLFHRSGKKPDATVVLATAIKDQFSFWEHELLKDPHGFAIIHDKTVVIDPFSVDCVVVTGSHNLGYRASYCNDENCSSSPASGPWPRRTLSRPGHLRSLPFPLPGATTWDQGLVGARLDAHLAGQVLQCRQPVAGRVCVLAGWHRHDLGADHFFLQHGCGRQRTFPTVDAAGRRKPCSASPDGDAPREEARPLQEEARRVTR